MKTNEYREEIKLLAAMAACLVPAFIISTIVQRRAEKSRKRPTAFNELIAKKMKAKKPKPKPLQDFDDIIKGNSSPELP